MFQTLDELDARLAGPHYLLGQSRTESDWRLFPTLISTTAWPRRGTSITSSVYYMTHGEIIQPIVPIGPALDLQAPHGRDLV